MSMGKGLAFAGIGAVVVAVIWVVLIRVTDWSLWIVAPAIGGAAGYGMMRGTKMKGGAAAGVWAAAVTVAGIFAARYTVVSWMTEDFLAVDEEEAVEHLAWQIAEEWEQEETECWDEDGELLPSVYAEAGERWEGMDADERQALTAELEGDSELAAGVLTPIALLFDFGIFGTICTVLAAGTAFKTGSTNLEATLIEQGVAQDSADADRLAGQLRAGDRFAMLGRSAGPAGPGQSEGSHVSGAGSPLPPIPAANPPAPRVAGVERADGGRDAA